MRPTSLRFQSGQRRASISRKKDGKLRLLYARIGRCEADAAGEVPCRGAPPLRVMLGSSGGSRKSSDRFSRMGRQSQTAYRDPLSIDLTHDDEYGVPRLLL